MNSLRKTIFTTVLLFVVTMVIEIWLNTSIQILFKIDLYIYFGLLSGLYLVYNLNQLYLNDLLRLTILFIWAFIYGSYTLEPIIMMLIILSLDYVTKTYKNLEIAQIFLAILVALLAGQYIDILATSILNQSLTYSFGDLIIRGVTLSAISSSLIITVFVFVYLKTKQRRKK